jgi:hypothetical protein
VIKPPPCGCATGWMCAEHEHQPFGHDACAGTGVRCRSAVCPYWQPVYGARCRLALDLGVQFRHWTPSAMRH